MKPFSFLLVGALVLVSAACEQQPLAGHPHPADKHQHPGSGDHKQDAPALSHPAPALDPHAPAGTEARQEESPKHAEKPLKYLP